MPNSLISPATWRADVDHLFGFEGAGGADRGDEFAAGDRLGPVGGGCRGGPGQEPVPDPAGGQKQGEGRDEVLSHGASPRACGPAVDRVCQTSNPFE